MAPQAAPSAAASSSQDSAWLTASSAAPSVTPSPRTATTASARERRCQASTRNSAAPGQAAAAADRALAP
ncbi:MAG: hypothetical protein QM767_22020 [Anaeromyxobacter sp.]